MVSTYCLVSDRWYSFALQADSRSALGTRCNGIDDISVHRPDTDIPAQCCNTKGNRSIGKYIHVLTFKRIASGNKNFYQKISSWSAVYTWFTFFTDAHALTIINTCRNGYGYLLLAGYIACSAAIRTFFLNNLTSSLAIRTGLYILYRSKE